MCCWFKPFFWFSRLHWFSIGFHFLLAFLGMLFVRLSKLFFFCVLGFLWCSLLPNWGMIFCQDFISRISRGSKFV